jgi:hypothetical protein
MPSVFYAKAVPILPWPGRFCQIQPCFKHRPQRDTWVPASTVRCRRRRNHSFFLLEQAFRGWYCFVYEKRKNNTMITETEVCTLLNRRIPGMQQELQNIGETSCAYKMAAFFAAYTKKLLHEGQRTEVEHCLKVAEYLMKYGNKAVKNAVENVYLYSVSQATTFSQDAPVQFPPLLKEAFKKQVNAAAI